MAKGFKDVFAEQQRILILQLLEKDSDHTVNNVLLQKGLEYVGHNISLDKVNTECAWLEEQGLVKVKVLNEDLSLVTATRTGIDVVLSRRVVPGVDMPIEGV